MAATANQLVIYRKLFNNALRSAAIYGSLARMEPEPDRAAAFEKLRNNEMENASLWAKQIGSDARSIRPARLGPASIILWLVTRLIGTTFIARILIRGHEQKLHEIALLPDPSIMAEAAREREMALRRLAYPEDSSDRDHHAGGFLTGEGGTLRAAVLGINDGLVSNFSLVMGVAGGSGEANIIILAGIAGLLAGAFSMAAGEYISMRSQKDVYENMVRLERAEIELWPEREKAELVGFYREKGLSEPEAQMVASRISSDPAVALNTHLAEEFGLNPDDLGSPWGASLASMVAFSAGAIIPIVPYLFTSSSLGLLISATLSGAALLVVGAGLAWLSGINWMWGAARMLVVGSAAAAVTYGIGSLIGQTV